MLEPGAQVEKYEVLGPLGGGGQGFVYKVRHVHLHTIHALKVLDPRMVQDEPHRARFLREGRIQAMLRHPAIAAVTDVVAAPGLAGLIVEYVEGSELDDWRDQLGRMPTLEETAAIFGPVLDALAIAHAQGIVHRDLKPANILVSSVDGQLAPKILDFGIARVRSELLDGAPRTRTGVQMGTAGFMSPEQIVPSGEIDGRSDLFSLAATIHAVVGGLEPFDAPSEFQTWGRITQGDYTPLRELAPEVDDGLVALVERGLEVDRADRWSDAESMARALRELAPGAPAPAPPRRSTGPTAAKTTSCASCHGALQPGWKLCPFCGAATANTCAGCGMTLQPGWKHCPSCGTSPGLPAVARATPVSAPAPAESSDSRGAAWAARLAFDEAFRAGCEAFLADQDRGFDEDAGVDDWLRRCAPARFEQAAQDGLSAIERALVRGGGALAPLQGGRHVLRGAIADLVDRMRVPANGLRRAADDVRELNLSGDTVTSFFRGAGEAVNPFTATGLGVAGGMALGSIVLPGIGTAIGGALGGWLGGSQTEKRQAQLLERYDDAHTAIFAALNTVYDSAWDLIAQTCGLPASDVFNEAVTTWNALLDGLHEEEDPVGRISVFIDEHGPARWALVGLVTRSVVACPPDVARAVSAAERALELYGWRPDTAEAQADAALASGVYEDALAAAERGLKLDGEHLGLRLSHVEALAASGDAKRARAQAEDLGATDLDPDMPVFALARGLARARRSADAVSAIERHIKDTGRPGSIMEVARADFVLGALVRSGQLKPPKSAADPKAIASRLTIHDDRSRRSLPAGDTGKNARAWIGNLNSGEKVLFFRDWSMWQNGKTGIVLTSARVVWKCMWEEPVTLHLSALSAEDVFGDDKDLYIGTDLSVDVEADGLGESLAEVIRELVALAQAGAASRGAAPPRTAEAPRDLTRTADRGNDCPRCKASYPQGTAWCSRCEVGL